MKKFYLLLTFAFCGFFANAQDPDAFIMTFEVTGQNLDITVPIVQDDANNYTIDFGDGTILTNQTGNASHTYSTAGIYTVSLTGTFGHIRFFGLSNILRLKLKTIEQWGSNQWSSMENAFFWCSNLIINAIDTPDLSQVTDMSNMFGFCENLNQDISSWDVSNVTDMSGMFYVASSFNQPLNNWDVSSVTNMSSMFIGAGSFNQPLNNWDVSSVTNMSSMFWNAEFFNQPLNDWNVSNVVNMSGMFRGASSFNQPLNNWDVSNVAYIHMMFAKTQSFNQPLNNWDISNVTSMATMFHQAQSFNQPLNNWDVSNVVDMGGMFYGAINFNQDISDWNFNENVYLGFHVNISAPFEDGFVGFSGLSIENYDLLLARFVNLELQNKKFRASELQYCDVETRDYLINSLGWTITEDSLAEAEDCSLGVSSLETGSFASFYPNPTNGILHLSSKENITIEEIKIYNLQGRELFGSVQHLETINIQDLSSGIYLMNIITNQGSVSKRVIKK